jgi:hypothetical protein
VTEAALQTQLVELRRRTYPPPPGPPAAAAMDPTALVSSPDRRGDGGGGGREARGVEAELVKVRRVAGGCRVWFHAWCLCACICWRMWCWCSYICGARREGSDVDAGCDLTKMKYH